MSSSNPIRSYLMIGKNPLEKYPLEEHIELYHEFKMKLILDRDMYLPKDDHKVSETISIVFQQLSLVKQNEYHKITDKLFQYLSDDEKVLWELL